MRRIIALMVLAAAIGTAHAHSWYPSECCSGMDCYPIQDDAVEFTAAGWLIKATGEVIPLEKAQFSPDGHFHRCSVRGSIGEETLCLFVPGLGG